MDTTDQFESAVDSVIAGDVAGLQRLLHDNPELIQARSTQPHRATLLHYLAANGVEQERQKSPANAVEIAKLLLGAGAEVDALASMYGGEQTTMNMLVSSTWPAQAGVQVPLLETLVDYGAAVDEPLLTALAFGYLDAAHALVRRGAHVDSLLAAAGLGYTDLARALLPAASSDDRHRALALAAQHGHPEVVAMLLDAGEDPNRFNPKGNHAHSTPLHQAALGGHDEVVRLLVERGARTDVRDTVYNATPLGWAEHAGRDGVADYLRTHTGGPNK